MRFSTICLLFLSTLGTSDAIHIHKLQQHVKHVLDAKVDVSWNNPANFPEENRSWGSLDVATNPQVAALFNVATGDNAGTVGAVPWSPWTLIMSNLPGPLLAAIPGGGCGNRYTIRQTCAGAGAPAHNGVYNWGVAAPVRTVSGAWECPGAGGVTQTYIGRDISQNGLVGRCRDYAPDGGIGATVAFSVAGNGRTGVPGAHQYRNFQQAAASCSCIYYRFKDYTNAVLPYTVCETGSSRRATRRWIKQRSGTDFVKNEEYLLINAQGGFGRAGATWNGVGGEQTGRTGNC